MFIFITVFVSIVYLVLITIFLIGWFRLSSFEPTSAEKINTKISLVIACRNEEQSLPKLLANLAQQSYQEFELLLINDHSTDSTLEIMMGAKSYFKNIQIIDALGFGKKNALNEGVSKADEKFIITTDADCTPSFHWLESIVSFQLEHRCDLVICPVKIKESTSFYDKLQVLEFSTLVASGAAASAAGMPILCNGASLAFTKKAWQDSWGELHVEEQSGDDIFLLQSIKKRGGKIRFLKSRSAFVFTNPAKTLPDFFAQRHRWAGKSTKYTDWQLIATAIVVFGVNLYMFCLLCLAIFAPHHWLQLLFVFVLKYFLDTIFLYNIRYFFQLDFVWFYALILSLIYPFYIVFVGISALVFKPKKW
jgi:cellulose synthase/poly-beta-1,6-N-acetylglucosamine synthase-like glycosyltransferase